MLYPVPGHTFLHVLVPERPSTNTHSARNDAATTASVAPPAIPRGSAAPLVKVALDATFGIRQIQALQRTRFSRTVLNHVDRQRRTINRRGPVNLESCHVRADGEIFGTAVSAGRRYGYAARIERGRLTSFRVL
ncbi:hypothetical protein [Corynebacterium cystitidis]|uniref:Uncharacterized protein n=1 Tax=Corynebacterium cystitidis DSM 20524 TaxID=1121357 RepID=A0A1H9QGZ7_9CORY|nr:hypothetical protein [Corynebacterium cystitidis]WJY81789.1 hypothetical protein CCYS_04175 [Corynebacterium cystitidis DSM 20524]SER59680.1 hypothetical protein SAMN05661109_00532 [Corynebacterium cystitidis DSM 20524]SNV83594.1 Uncharacterised protein [Corynebacterium cystitidis]